MNPELSGLEFNTARKITEVLESLGIDVANNIGAPYPGVVGLLRGSQPGPTVALRADMDALKQQEKRESPYKSSIDGVMHGCGHDAHMAIQLGTAEIISKYRDKLKGNVKFIFQPSEEINGGAVPMIGDGVLDNPSVDAIFGLHVDGAFKTGQTALSYGETMASSDRLIIHILGRSSHAAYPHEGVDAIVIAAHVLVALQSLISREKDAFHPAVLSFGVIEGGKQPNAICEDVLIRGILRTLNPDTRELLIKRVEETISYITKAFHGGYEFVREKSYDSLINHDHMVDFQKDICIKIIGEDNVRFLPRARMITEDFAYYLQKVPGAMLFLGTGNSLKNTELPLHNTSFDIDEDALAVGVAIQTALAWEYLMKNQ
jgi:amidohydrolase